MKILIAFLCLFTTCRSATSNVCLLEPETGPCKAYFPRFYYDAGSKTCKRFVYGGCGGNGNNFGDEESCHSACSGNKRDVSEDACFQKAESGLCRGYFPRYYYDSATQSCKVFIYGGCGGNSNSFDSEEECLASCKVDVCSLEAETGPCRAYIPRYAYDSVSGSCKRFVYGGCDGNANSFGSEEECMNSCGRAKKRAVVNGCELEPETGPCRGYFPRYAYDSATSSCKQFIYGGCRGNANNFPTEEECYNICADKKRQAKDICMLEPQSGMCLAYFPRYYYDHVSKSCKMFVYGGCGGNENNFGNENDCMTACGH